MTFGQSCYNVEHKMFHVEQCINKLFVQKALVNFLMCFAELYILEI